jgi:hypothetical protein
MKKIQYSIVGILFIILVLPSEGVVGSPGELSNTAECSYDYPVSQGPVLEVTTDKILYGLGEPVTIFLTNIGNETLSGGGPIITIFNSDEEIVYQEATYCWYELDPGDYIEWFPWNQTDQQGQQVPLGSYVAEGFLSGVDEDYVDNTTFMITDYELPTPPKITGPQCGKINTEYTFFLGDITNPDEDQLFCIWDWGDGMYGEWLGPYNSNETICGVHTWVEPGTYRIKVKVKDIYGLESNWSEPFIISITAQVILMGFVRNVVNHTEASTIYNMSMVLLLKFHPIDIVMASSVQVLILNEVLHGVFGSHIFIAMVYAVILNQGP